MIVASPDSKDVSVPGNAAKTGKSFDIVATRDIAPDTGRNWSIRGICPVRSSSGQVWLCTV